MQIRMLTMPLLAVLMATAGCSREEQESESTADHSRLPEDNVFSDQVKTLERAEGVQQTLDDAAATQREEIERQEQR